MLGKLLGWLLGIDVGCVDSDGCPEGSSVGAYV